MHEIFRDINGQKESLTVHSSVSASNKKSRATIKKNVFNTIVALCQNRILSRLGLPGSLNGKKRFIGLNLEEFLCTPWQSKAVRSHNPGIRKRDIEKYRLQTQALLTHLYALNTTITPKHDDVVELVRHIVGYMASVPLETLLGCLGNQDMDPNSRERLVTCFSKVARYRDSATFLYQRAKKLDMLRRTSVEQVQLRENAFERPAEAAFTGTVQSVLGSLSNGETTTLGINSLPPWEQKAIESASDRLFAKQVNNRLQESKIHAEIQIIAHYENASPGVLRPRVIASCKDACYLCNTCISLQGKYSVPKSHGKLYPGWRLPTTQQFLPLQKRLNAFLEQEILATVKKLSQATKKPSIKYRNESTIFPLHISASTLTTFSNASSLHLVEVSQPNHDGRPVDNAPSVAHQEHIETSTTGPPHAESLHEQLGGVHRGEKGEAPPHVCAKGLSGMAEDRDEAETSHAAGVNDISTPSRSDFDTPGSCAAGSLDRCSTLSGSRVGGSNSWFRKENMEIFLESSSELVPEWLSPEDSAEVLRDRPELIVDVLLLAAGMDDRVLPKSPDGSTYFAFGDRVVMINARP